MRQSRKNAGDNLPARIKLMMLVATLVKKKIKASVVGELTSLDKGHGVD